VGLDGGGRELLGEISFGFFFWSIWANDRRLFIDDWDVLNYNGN
jgi:hypothetical protein